jgi:pentatricopeptide repeat protein
MISKGHQPDVRTYSILINGNCKKREIDKAMNILDEMISKGHQPNVITYSILIWMCCARNGRLRRQLVF